MVNFILIVFSRPCATMFDKIFEFSAIFGPEMRGLCPRKLNTREEMYMLIISDVRITFEVC